MSKKATLNKIAPVDWPAIAHDLAKNAIRAYVVIPPVTDWVFHYSDGSWAQAKQGRYQLHDPTELTWSLLHPRWNKEELLVVYPGKLVDESDKCFMLYYDEFHFDADGVFEHRIEQDGNSILVDVPAQFLQLEWPEPDKKTFRPRSAAGLLVWKYLKTDPNGNLAGLRAWGKEEAVFKFFKKNNKKCVSWIDDLGIHQEIREKRLSDLLSEYRNNLD